MTGQSNFLSILLITILVALVPLVASRRRMLPIPIVIGEILAGMLIGKSGFNWVSEGPILEFLSEFGFVFLMFLSGLEVDLSQLSIPKGASGKNRSNGTPLYLALLYFGLTVAGSFAVVFGLRQKGLIENPLIVGLILGTTSLGIVVPVLKEKGMINNPFGQTLLLSALIADFATLIFLSIAFAFLKKGIVFQLIFLMLFLTAVALSLRLGIKLSRSRALQKIFKDLSLASSHVRVRGAIALMVTWAALAHFLGTEVILGAFIAGIIVNILAGPEELVLREKLDVLGFGFFIPFFFIMVGSRFEWRELMHSSNSLLLIPILVLAAYLVKLVPSLIFRWSFNWKESFSAGLLLSSRLSLIIAASAIALQLRVISEGVNAALILVAMITCTISPVLFNRFAPSRDDWQRKGIMIVGINQLTALLIDRLKRDGEEIFLLGCPDGPVDKGACRGVEPIIGDPTNRVVLERAGAEKVAALVAVLEEGEDNFKVCRQARELGVPLLISRTDDFRIMEKMKTLGVRVIQPVLTNAIALEGALRFPAIFDLLTDQGEDVALGEGILKNVQLVGLPLHRVRLPGNALVMGIRRKGEVIVPHGDTKFQKNDVVMFLGNSKYFYQAKGFLEGIGGDFS